MATQNVINTLYLVTLLLLFTTSQCKPHRVLRGQKQPSSPNALDELDSTSNQTITNSTVANTSSVSASSETPDVSGYVSLLQLNNYYGQWALAEDSDSNNFESFQNTNGIIALDTQTSELPAIATSATISEYVDTRKLYFDPPSPIPQQASSSTNNGLLQLLIKIYDGSYLDDQSLRINYVLNSTGNMVFLADTATIYEDYQLSGISLRQPGGSEVTYQNCMLNISMAFLDQNTMTPYQGPFDDNDNLGIIINITSGDCNFSVQSQLLTRDGLYTESEIIAYIITSCVISVAQIIGVILVKKSFDKRQNLFNLSATSLFLTIALDYCVLVLNLIMVFSDNAILCIPLVFNLVLTFIFERNLIMTLFQSRSQRTGQNLSDKDCKTCGCYFIAIGVFFVLELALILMYQLWVLYLTALVLLPQIVQNIYKNRTYKFNYGHILLMVTPKIAMIGYLRLYPGNIFRISPEPMFVAIYGSIILIQIAILIIQTRYPRFYSEPQNTRKSSRALGEDDICPICMGHLACTNADISPTFPRKKTIETTCTHNFHTQCLKKWLNKRTDCPMCRNNIADILEEMDFSEEDTRSPELRSPAVVHGESESVYYAFDL